MAVVRLEIKTRRPLADGRKFDQVGCYEQLDGSAHFAVDPAHRLNCSVTDIDLAERGRDGLVHFTADERCRFRTFGRRLSTLTRPKVECRR